MSIIREISKKAQKYLDHPEILLFVGARQVGKTTILKQLQAILKDSSENIFFLNLEDPEYLSLLNKNPKNLFKIFSLDQKQKNYLLVDEIQYLKDPSNFLKYLHDEHSPNLKIIATGSSAFYIDQKFKDSLAGRKKIFYVATLSFREFLNFKNETRLAALDFQNPGLADLNKISDYYHEFMTYGGYPRVVLSPVSEKKEILREIAFSYIKKDIYESGVKNEENFYKLFRILAAQSGELLNASSLANALNVSKTAIDNYLYIMQKSFHIALLKPFFKNAKKELTKMPKVYFRDLGLYNFFMNSFDAFTGRHDKGKLLESAAFRQLNKDFNNDDLRFWRTQDGHEVDFVKASSCAYEIKSDEKRFNPKKYQKFNEAYPNIPISPVCIDKRNKKTKDGTQILNVWEL